MKNISVIGLGYVGLPTAIKAAESGFNVTGVDINPEKINKLKLGISYVEGITSEAIKRVIMLNNLELHCEIQSNSQTNIFLVCVPTPLTSEKKPDLSFLITAINNVGKSLSPGNLVIIESTVAPGTVRGMLLPLLEKASGLESKDFYLVFSPERIDPGNKVWTLQTVPKLVAGINEDSTKLAIDFYSKFIENLVPVASIEIAETAKLLENSFRYINISFINELAMFCNALRIDINEVINAAATKPYGFMPFYPSLGAGGHCIPVDPLYLSNKAKEIGSSAKFIELADEINIRMPRYIASLVVKILGPLRNKVILVVGVAYKPNISDVRETPAAALIRALQDLGANVVWHDDLVKSWNGESSKPLKGNYDLAILATLHDYIDLSKLGNVPVLNTRNSI